MWFKIVLSTLYPVWFSNWQPDPHSTGLHLQVPASTITLGTYHFLKYSLIPTRMCRNHALTLSQTCVYILPVDPFYPDDFISLLSLWHHFFHPNFNVLSPSFPIMNISEWWSVPLPFFSSPWLAEEAYTVWAALTWKDHCRPHCGLQAPPWSLSDAGYAPDLRKLIYQE